MFFNLVLSLTVALVLAVEKNVENENSIESWPENCAKAYPRLNGFYIIKVPNTNLKKFYAYCEVDPDGDHAWTRIQHNTNGSSNDFARSWKAYKHGFGNIGGDHFIGLEKLYALTQSEPHELWIQLEDHMNIQYNIKYNLFAIDNEEEDYKLTALGAYTGFLKDLLRVHIGSKFYTHDRDNKRKCAQLENGGWWFNNCFPTFLNGNRIPKRSGIVWGDDSSTNKMADYKTSKMSIRPLRMH